MIVRIPIAAALCLILGLPSASAETVRQLRAHEHGHAALTIAVERNTVQMEFIAPGADIVGFEHTAESQHDQAKIEEAKAALSKPLDLFVVPADAGCAVVSAAVEIEGEADHARGHEGRGHGQASALHSEFHAEYTIECSAIDRLTEIRVQVFQAFPSAKEIAATMLSAKGQRAVKLDKESTVIDLRGLI